MAKAKCPSCNKVIELQIGTKVQDLVSCPRCKTILEFVKKYPPTLDWVDDPAVSFSRRIFQKKY